MKKNCKAIAHKFGHSIKYQLILIQMITCTIALIVAGIVFGMISYKNNKCSAIEHLECHSELLAHKAIPSLQNNSPEDALKILETLHAEQSLVSASIFDSNGIIFASYLPCGNSHSHSINSSKVKSTEMHKKSIHAYTPVIQNGHFIGAVCIGNNLNSINCIVRQNIITLIIVIAGTFLLSILIALKLQAAISSPIVELTKKALRISISSDYALRMPTEGSKETQMLSNALNEMITATQKIIRELNDKIGNLTKTNHRIKISHDNLKNRMLADSEEIKRVNEDLYSEKHEHEQSERMLQLALTKLETTNKELERFAQVSAHDLQEPLRKIKAFSDRILSKAKKGSTNERIIEYTNFILKSASQMQFMVNDLMSFSTLGRRKPIMRTLDINTVIDFVLKDLKNEIDESKAKITVGILPTIEAEKQQMQQMFRHLILNSIKFRQADTPLAIDISSSENSDGTVTIAVRDNGIGFDQKYATRIFEIFQQLHAHIPNKGTGVGLAICKRISSVHGGSIRVESTPKKGSTFFVTLPSEHRYERTK